MIHTVKGFGIVNEAEDVFLELSYFFNDPMDVGKLISGLIYFAHLNIYKYRKNCLRVLFTEHSETKIH